MSNVTERTWTMVMINDAVAPLMKTYIDYPPRKMQSEGYTGPLTLSAYERFQYMRESLAKDGFTLSLHSGN